MADELQLGQERNIENQQLVIGPARSVVLGQEQGLPRSDASPGDVAAVPGDVESRFAAMAPYWLDGLHNFEGVATAAEINKILNEKKLVTDKEAIARLLATYPKARRLGVDIVPESKYLGDPDLKKNLSEPVSLLNGTLVRDSEGGYRPKAGGVAVLQDLGTSLVLKSKTKETYRAAMELAVAKGWTAIELTGKPAMLADAWVEAQLLGLNVVNYAPSELDREKYAARLAEISLQSNAAQAPLPQALEKVEIRPFLDAHGHEKTATVTYTVTYANEKDIQCDTPQKAAQAFATSPAKEVAVVIRTLTRADGLVREDLVAGSERRQLNGKVSQSIETMLDEEFEAALLEVEGIEKFAAKTIEPVTSGTHIGAIVAVEGDRIAQKIGRDPSNVVWHNASNLAGKIPVVGQITEIGYSKGQGTVKSEPQARSLDSGGRALGR